MERRLAELQGREEEYAEQQERNRRQQLQALLDLAVAQGDEEQAEKIRERIRLSEELRRAEEKAAREREQERQREEEAAERTRQADEQASRARSGGVTRSDEPRRIILESGLGRDGRPQFTQADVQAVAQRVIEIIETDRGRT
jgi:septal ring factor EnvC (AmiA/AmiB activator)